MVIQCELCTADVLTADELHTHFSSHFSSGRCGNCHAQLIVVDGLIYMLQLHNQFGCTQSSFDDTNQHDGLGAIGDIKTEIEELPCEPFLNDSLEISLDEIDRKPDNDSEEPPNENLASSTVEEAESNVIGNDNIVPFEMVDCNVIKIENESQGSADSHATFKNARPRRKSFAIGVKKRSAKRTPIKLSLKPISADDLQCNICDKYFRARSDLTKHKRWHYRVIGKDEIDSARVSIDESKIDSLPSDQVFISPTGEKQIRQFRCTYCQKYVLTAHSLREHIKRAHLFAYSDRNLTAEECKRIPSEQIYTKVSGEKCLKTHKCDDCDKYFLRRESLINHKKLHKQLIGKKDSKAIPADQISVKPSGEMFLRKFKCSVCDKYFLAKTSLASHMHSHKRQTMAEDSSSNALTETGPESATADDRIFVRPSGERQLREEKCETCGKFYVSKHTLRQHIRRVHLLVNKGALLTDEECSELPNEQVLTRVTGEKILRKFQCTVCNKFLMSAYILASHMKLHEQRANVTLTEAERNKLPTERVSLKPTGEAYLRKYKCSLCDKYFLTQSVLASHQKAHQRRTYRSDTIADASTEQPLGSDRIYVNATGEKQFRDLQCDQCGKYLLSKHTLRRHIRIVHHSMKTTLEKAQILTEEESLKLPAQQVLTTSTGVKIWRRYQCDICTKYFTTKSSIQIHMRNYHCTEPDGAEHVCSICHKIFKNRLSLKTHRETHTAKRLFICVYCGKECKTSHHLNQHTNSHTGAKPYKCTICGKGFGGSPLLNAHHRVHTGEKPYKCTQEGCERAYAYSVDLKRHLYGAHGIYTKKFECSICSRIFPENKLLTKHMNSHV